MSVEQSRSIDMVSLDDGELVLTVSDHLDWSDSTQHQHILQEKLNTYLAFVESGEVYEHKPEAKGHPIVFEIVFKYRPDQPGRAFLERVEDVIKKAGFLFRQELFAESYDN